MFNIAWKIEYWEQKMNASQYSNLSLDSIIGK